MMSGKGFYGLVLTPGDKLLMGTLLVLSLASIGVVHRLVQPGSVAVVEVDGHEVHRLDLSVDCRRVVAGSLGETVIQVNAGEVRVESSPCPHKLCARIGWVRRTGSLIVCVPNRVLVRVEGGEHMGEPDAVTW
jgi:hypothetical protein